MDHVGIEPERDQAGRRPAAGHGLEGMDRAGARMIDAAVLARHVDGVAVAKIAVGRFQRFHTGRHFQECFDIFVGDHQHGAPPPGLMNEIKWPQSAPAIFGVL